MANFKLAMNPQDISDVLSVFHDGTPQDWKITDGDLEFRISCQYIAELVSPEFKYFQLKVHHVGNFEYNPWEPFSVHHSDLKTEEILNKCDFEIMTSELRNDRIIIICNEISEFFDTPGGDILLTGSSLTIAGEDGRIFTREELLEISKTYWTKFGKK